MRASEQRDKHSSVGLRLSKNWLCLASKVHCPDRSGKDLETVRLPVLSVHDTCVSSLNYRLLSSNLLCDSERLVLSTVSSVLSTGEKLLERSTWDLPYTCEIWAFAELPKVQIIVQISDWGVALFLTIKIKCSIFLLRRAITQAPSSQNKDQAFKGGNAGWAARGCLGSRI